MEKKIIFLIDDAPLIISRIRTLLQDVGGIGEIISAEGYEAAARLLAEITPDLVILDINLGDRSGIDLLQHIHGHYPSVTVIMLTNQDSPFHRAICRQLGAAHFIDKSIEFGRLRSIVTDLCRPND